MGYGPRIEKAFVADEEVSRNDMSLTITPIMFAREVGSLVHRHLRTAMARVVPGLSSSIARHGGHR